MLRLTRFRLMCSAEQVIELINRPVVGLVRTRVGGTLLRDRWDVGSHGGGEECLSETSRPGFVSTVRPDLPEPTHGLEEEDTLGGILFLGLKDSHLRPKYRVLNGSHYALL